jgi:DNA mismatch endonuclease (patch repair protein)
MPFEDVPTVVRRRMSRIRKTGSKPEVLVRQIAHALGYRFRLNRADLPGTPDIVFPAHRKAIFVHGCFWHQHPGCRHANVPQVRLDYWIPKLRRTTERDALAMGALDELGWSTMVLWECELKDRTQLTHRLSQFLKGADGTAKSQ